jgi:hypothetical protein
MGTVETMHKGWMATALRVQQHPLRELEKNAAVMRPTNPDGHPPKTLKYNDPQECSNVPCSMPVRL